MKIPGTRPITKTSSNITQARTAAPLRCRKKCIIAPKSSIVGRFIFHRLRLLLALIDPTAPDCAGC